MKRPERNYLTLQEFIECYPKEYLEFLSVFEDEGQKRVLLDNEAIKIIDLLNEKTERLKTEKLNSFLYVDTSEKIVNPKHQTIFCNNGFELFEAFSKLHIIDKYIDFSFLFQQMKFNGYILDIKHVKFMDWLLENEYINPKEHKTFLIEKSFRSLKKCAFGTRVDLYLKLKNSIIPINSDLSE